jgi:RNA polymerase sigma-70 factor (ECF subfamily)
MSDPSNCQAALVKRAIAGDADAFGELYLSHLDAIYRYVYFRVGDAHDAEDLTEQVFLKAWEALPVYRPRGNPFASWVYRIAHNLVIDYRRRQKPVEPMPSPEPSDQADEKLAFLEQVIAAEEARTLSQAIRQLPEEQQQVIVLRFIEGLRHAEVARILGKSEGACRMIEHRALMALYQLLNSTAG